MKKNLTPVFIWLVVSSLFLISGCSLPLLPEKQLNLKPYFHAKALLEKGSLGIHHLPANVDGQGIMGEILDVWKEVGRWLNIELPTIPISILIFSPQEQIGKDILHRSRTRHQATGFYNHNESVLVVVGQPGDSRFFTVLRHESAHAALHSGLQLRVGIPFWLDEGVAAFFEQNRVQHVLDGTKNERLALLQHYLKKGETLQFEELIQNQDPRLMSGKFYARSWGLVACLYNQKRPVHKYLSGLSGNSQPSQKLFNQSFLLPGESFEQFEKSCSDWLQSQ